MTTLLCTITDLEELLQLTISTATQVSAAQAAITEASAAIRGYCHQMLTPVTDEVITLDGNGGTHMLLPELPVTSVVSVVENDKALVVDDDYRLGRYGVLYRIGTVWASGVQNIVVTYSHGYTTLPDDVVGVCARAAARRYQAGLRAAMNAGVPGIVSTQLGDYSVTFGSEQGSGGEGVLGVSAASILLRSEREVLARYRRNP